MTPLAEANEAERITLVVNNYSGHTPLCFPPRRFCCRCPGLVPGTGEDAQGSAYSSLPLALQVHFCHLASVLHHYRNVAFWAARVVLKTFWKVISWLVANEFTWIKLYLRQKIHKLHCIHRYIIIDSLNGRERWTGLSYFFLPVSFSAT